MPLRRLLWLFRVNRPDRLVSLSGCSEKTYEGLFDLCRLGLVGFIESEKLTAENADRHREKKQKNSALFVNSAVNSKKSI